MVTRRLEQVLLISTFAGFSWLAMQGIHELGHVLGAAASGGVVSKVILHPFAFSRTDVSPNPHPLFVVWAGPIIGALLPLAAFLAAAALRSPWLYLLRFFSGFCLIANGAYIAGGSVEGLADAGDMLHYGSARWQLVLFGLPAASLGLYLWNGLGPRFGLGQARGKVSRSATITSVILFGSLALVEILISDR